MHPEPRDLSTNTLIGSGQRLDHSGNIDALQQSGGKLSILSGLLKETDVANTCTVIFNNEFCVVVASPIIRPKVSPRIIKKCLSNNSS